MDGTGTGTGTGRQLLVRRNTATGKCAFSLCSTPQPTPLSTLVRVAGVRWPIEECSHRPLRFAWGGECLMPHCDARLYNPMRMLTVCKALEG
ncbi:hypothetical protein ACFRIC_04690 [Streptomyces sp. NPDC056738]|uniref:hypothetical protein n=1 Tax=Streptomyces sp. NPDC056738 TaxID=3345933 RepID=UPI00368A66E6